jgi:hypothetical protein
MDGSNPAWGARELQDSCSGCSISPGSDPGRKSKNLVDMKIVQWLGIFAAAMACQAAVPTWDTSGNGMLNGTYYFREVVYGLASGGGGALNSADVIYGTISFNSAAGTYSGNVTLYDAAKGGEQGSVSGTYAVAASGYAIVSHPVISGAYIYGTVSQQGIFVGNGVGTGYNDLFIAAPLAWTCRAATRCTT